MDRVFQDDETENEFRSSGYVVRPLLDAAEVEAVKRLYDSLPEDMPSDFYATVFSRNADYRRRVSQGIGSIAEEKLRRLLPNHELCFSLFVTKRQMSKAGTLPLHRDYSFVDHGRYTAIHIWVPLIDVDETNGCLRLVKGSHTLMESPYAVNEYPSPFHPVRETLEREFTTRVPMPAGSALLYDSRLLHGSGENLSGRLRLAIVCIVLPAGVPPRVYVWDGVKPTRFDVLEVNREFLLEMERGAPVKKPYPPGVSYLETVDYPVQPLEPRDIARLKRPQ